MFTTDMSKELASTTIEIVTITIGEHGITIEGMYISICEHGITVETVTVMISEHMIAVEVVRTSLYTFFVPVWDVNIASLSLYGIEHVVVGYGVTTMRTEVLTAIMFV